MLILLDIDGVMIPAKPWSPPPILADGFIAFSPQARKALNFLLDNTNADVMLITSHKHHFPLDEWVTIFKNRGIHLHSISRLPTDTLEMSREQELLEWYAEFDGSQKFVILDDDKRLNNLPENLKSKLILTKPYIGLTMALAEEAVEILKASEEEE